MPSDFVNDIENLFNSGTVAGGDVTQNSTSVVATDTVAPAIPINPAASDSVPVELINSTVFAELFVHAVDVPGLTAAINKLCPGIGINNDEALKVFLAETSYESAHFTELSENLNYSAQALLTVFPTHFSSMEDAVNYARQPEKIANHVYASRYGNGNEASGDGWKYRGRGAIGLTFFDNYQAFATSNNITDINAAVSYCETSEGAVAAATWFWQTHNIPCASRDDMTTATRIINGDDSTNPQRLQEYDRIAGVLG